MEEGYTILTLDEAVERMDKDDRSWALCYDGEIPHDVWDWDLHMEVTNPDFIPGKQERYAYFTPDIDKQWGDDWGDTINDASEPYPSREEGIDEIIIVPYAIPDQEKILSMGGSVDGPTWTYDTYKSTMNPMIINRCKMPWVTVMMYPANRERRHPYYLKFFCLRAGDSPKDMKNWIESIQNFVNENYK